MIAFYALFTVALGLAFVLGGKPERVGAAIHLALFSFQGASYLILPTTFATVDLVSLATDCLGMLGFGWLALNANRFWPIWAASIQLLSISGHFARWIDLKIDPYAYVILTYYPTAAGLFVLITGVLVHHRRIRTLREDTPWVAWD